MDAPETPDTSSPSPAPGSGQYFQSLTTEDAWKVCGQLGIREHPEFQWVISDYEEGASKGVMLVPVRDRGDGGQKPPRDIEPGEAWFALVDVTDDPTEPSVDALDDESMAAFTQHLEAEVRRHMEVEQIEHSRAQIMNGGYTVRTNLTHREGGTTRWLHHNRFEHDGRRWVAMFSVPHENARLSSALPMMCRLVLLPRGGRLHSLPAALRPLRPVESVRDLMLDWFELTPDALPISGGWGYSRKDACVIEKNHPAHTPGAPFNGVGIEHLFVEKRLYTELIVTRPEHDCYAGIRWNLDCQRMLTVNGRDYDHLVFDVTCFRARDWERLKAEHESPEGYGHPDFDLARHEADRDAQQLRFKHEFWFHITSFYR